MKKAVLFITFNRFETTKEVFNQIRKAQPPRLYLASDGPRKNKKDETEIVANIRKWLMDNIDWKCEIKTRFLEENSGGCAYAIPAAINWFFENEEDGIILEDDCVPTSSFFNYCEELLDKYKKDKRIWHIAGTNPIENIDSKYSYYFAKIQHCWGWATWKDRWQHFNINLPNYNPDVLDQLSPRAEVRMYWLKILSRNLALSHQTTWDYQWAFTIIANKGYCINPCKNMVSNIGLFGEHYNGKSKDLMRNTYEIDQIIHPKKIEFNEEIIDKIFTQAFGISHSSLYADFVTYYKKDRKNVIYLFNFIPFIKIKNKNNRTKVYLFEFIPLLKIKGK